MSKDKVYLISGTTRGFGESIALKLEAQNSNVIHLNRRSNNNNNNNIIVDLANILSVKGKLPEILERVKDYKHVVFIANAAVLGPLVSMGRYSTEEIEVVTNVNYISPLIISNALEGSCEKLSLVNITSGAAQGCIEGLGLYCATKAALLSSFITSEKEIGDHVNFLNFDPGVMDTEMQKSLRKAGTSFKRVSEFRKLKDDGALSAVSEIAQRLINQLEELS